MRRCVMVSYAIAFAIVAFVILLSYDAYRYGFYLLALALWVTDAAFLIIIAGGLFRGYHGGGGGK